VPTTLFAATIYPDVTPGTKEKKKMDATIEFRHAFWKHYAERHQDNPFASDFRDGWGFHTPWYWVEEAELNVKQWLGSSTVGVYVAGKDGEDKAEAEARLATYRELFDAITNNYHPPEAPPTALCANSIHLDGGTRDPKNWDRMADFMEEYRQKYEQILRS